MDKSYSSIHKSKQELNLKKQDLNKEIILIEKKISRSASPKSTNAKVIEVVFSSQEEQKIKIDVSYVAFKASWYPVYKIDVDQELTKVNMTMFANITQTSGENWDSVKMTVSNSVPMTGGGLPDPQSWQLKIPQPDYGAPMAVAAAMPHAGGATRASLSEGDEVCSMLSCEEMALEEPAEFSAAESKETPLAFEYDLKQDIDIKSAKGETLLPLFCDQLNPDFYIHSVPGIDPLAYLACSISPGKALLSGTLNIHFGGRFSGTTFLTDKKAGEKLLLNLGVERSVLIQKETSSDKTAETFFGKVERSTIAREICYTIRAENIKNKAVRVKNFDSLPVSVTDKIVIKGLETNPKPTEKNYLKKEGVALWEFTLDPESIKEISIKFMVKHPRYEIPTGL